MYLTEYATRKFKEAEEKINESNTYPISSMNMPVIIRNVIRTLKKFKDMKDYRINTFFLDDQNNFRHDDFIIGNNFWGNLDIS
jgi:hypothetical protein